MARPVVVGLASVGTALIAHRASGAPLPDPLLLALLTLPVLAVAAVARRLPFLGQVGLAGVGQLVLHQAFMLLAGGGPVVVLAPSGHGHAHGVVASSSSHAVAMGSHDSLTATALHALATLAVALLVARGDGLLTGLRSLLFSLVVPRPLAVAVLPLRRPLPVPVALTVARDAALARLLPARGPPLLLGL